MSMDSNTVRQLREIIDKRRELRKQADECDKVQIDASERKGVVLDKMSKLVEDADAILKDARIGVKDCTPEVERANVEWMIGEAAMQVRLECAKATPELRTSMADDVLEETRDTLAGMTNPSKAEELRAAWLVFENCGYLYGMRQRLLDAIEDICESQKPKEKTNAT